jgi:uncharacterized protein YabN with tetrapyrrole methylase and pyrophosphatase domain
VVAKIEEEIGEWREAAGGGDADARCHEIGDLLLSLVNLARRRRVDPGERAARRQRAVSAAASRPSARKAASAGRDVSETRMEELDRYWEEAKGVGRVESRVSSSSVGPCWNSS